MSATMDLDYLVPATCPDRYGFSFNRLASMLNIAVPAYRDSIPPFGKLHWLLPEDAITLPPEILVDADLTANFYFWSCLFMRGKMKSVQAMTRLYNLYIGERDACRPCTLDARVAVTMTEEEIGDILAHYGLYRSFARGWKINAERLLERYDGKILNALKDVETYDEVCNRFRNRRGQGFWGFQKKMTSMALYYLMGEGLIKSIPFPPPVDYHHISLAVRLGVVNLKGNILDGTRDLEDGCLDDMRQGYMMYSELTGISTAVLARAFWLLSAYLCMKAPGNGLISRGEQNGRSTELVYEAPDFTTANAAVIEAWIKTCAICPLREHCTKLMPSSQWYDWGQLGAIITERTEPPPERVIGHLFNPHILTSNHRPRSKGKKIKRIVAPPVFEQPLFDL